MIGNKSDLASRRAVTTKEGEQVKNDFKAAMRNSKMDVNISFMPWTDDLYDLYDLYNVFPGQFII